MTTCPMERLTCPMLKFHAPVHAKLCDFWHPSSSSEHSGELIEKLWGLLDTQGITDLFHIGRWRATKQRSVQAMMHHCRKGKHGSMLHPWLSYLSS